LLWHRISSSLERTGVRCGVLLCDHGSPERAGVRRNVSQIGFDRASEGSGCLGHGRWASFRLPEPEHVSCALRPRHRNAVSKVRPRSRRRFPLGSKRDAGSAHRIGSGGRQNWSLLQIPPIHHADIDPVHTFQPASSIQSSSPAMISSSRSFTFQIRHSHSRNGRHPYPSPVSLFCKSI